MINYYKNIRRLFSVSILVCICFLSSCTYDYFEDETNYVVYIPKADENVRTDTYKVDDVRIFIYNNSTLDRERHSYLPFQDNARTRVGNFHFKLYPGQHSVHCFSQADKLLFSGIDSYATTNFSLTQSKDGFYNEPEAILIETHKPMIQFPGPAIADTTWYEKKYVGRICVAFKNLQNISSKLTFDNIKKVEIVATGVGTMQYFSQVSDSINTRSSRKSTNDIMRLTTTLYKSPYAGFDFGFDNYYFPSLSRDSDNLMDEAIGLRINFLDDKNDIIYDLNVDVVDMNDGYKPMILHMNETLLVTVDGNNIQILRLANPLDWDPNIQEGGNNTPGEGGTEI
jgi:hypothetical protein